MNVLVPISVYLELPSKSRSSIYGLRQKVMTQPQWFLDMTTPDSQKSLKKNIRLAPVTIGDIYSTLTQLGTSSPRIVISPSEVFKVMPEKNLILSSATSVGTSNFDLQIVLLDLPIRSTARLIEQVLVGVRHYQLTPVQTVQVFARLNQYVDTFLVCYGSHPPTTLIDHLYVWLRSLIGSQAFYHLDSKEWQHCKSEEILKSVQKSLSEQKGCRLRIEQFQAKILTKSLLSSIKRNLPHSIASVGEIPYSSNSLPTQYAFLSIVPGIELVQQTCKWVHEWQF